jgi:hypothetical protein
MTYGGARALTFEAIIAINQVLDTAEYHQDFFAGADAILQNSENLMELPFDPGIPPTLDAGQLGAIARDAKNSRAVYEFLGAIDSANASDRRLWTYQALATFRPYMESRWPLEGISNWKGRARNRWLMGTPTRGRLIRHGVSRLWWVASLTYDPSCRFPLAVAAEDPFAYTDAVLQNEDRLNALFDREVGAIPSLVRAVLEHAAEGNGQGSDDHVRAVMKELTLIYGYRDVGVLEDKALRSLVDSIAV